MSSHDVEAAASDPAAPPSAPLADVPAPVLAAPPPLPGARVVVLPAITSPDGLSQDWDEDDAAHFTRPPSVAFGGMELTALPAAASAPEATVVAVPALEGKAAKAERKAAAKAAKRAAKDAEADELEEVDWERSERASKRRPYLSIAVLLGCLGVFSYTLWLTRGITPLSENPMIGPSRDALVTMGAKVTRLIVSEKQWWRLVSSNFEHAGVVHIIINTVFLLRAGSDLEREAGRLKYALIFLVSGVNGMAASALFAPLAVTVGASASLFGVLGAHMASLAQNLHFIRSGKCLAVTMTVASVLLNIAIGLLPGVDNFAHLGGLFSGFFIGLPLLPRTDGGGRFRTRQVVLAVCGAIAFVLMSTALYLVLAYGLNGAEFCPWCKYASCVPAPWWDCDAQ